MNKKKTNEKNKKIFIVILITIVAVVALTYTLKNKKELNLFITDYYERYSGLYLKSKDFLEILTKI